MHEERWSSRFEGACLHNRCDSSFPKRAQESSNGPSPDVAMVEKSLYWIATNQRLPATTMCVGLSP